MRHLEGSNHLMLSPGVIDRLEEIYAASPFNKIGLRQDIESQATFLERALKRTFRHVTVTRARQNCYNVYFTLSGDRDEIAWADSLVMVYAFNRAMKHLLVLEWDGK